MIRSEVRLLVLTAIILVGAVAGSPLASAPNTGFAIITGATDQAFPDIIFNSLRSEFLLVYEDRIAASQFRIYAQRLNANGMPISVPVVVAETPKQHRRPRAALNRSNGEYMVVWYDDDAQNGVFGRRLSALAEPVGDIIVIAPPSHGEIFATVAYSPSPPHYLASWIDYRNVTADVFAQRLSTNGQLLGGNIGVSQAPQSQFSPAIVYNDFSGLFFVAWADRRLGTGAVDIYGRFVANDGTLFGSEILICSAGNDQWTPAVTVNEQNGEMLVVWQDERNAPQTYSLYGQRLSFTGGLLGGNFAVASFQSNFQASPRVAYGNGAYLVSWEDKRSIGQETYDIYARWFTTAGAPLGADLAIAIDPGDQGWPVPVYQSDLNRFLIVWVDDLGVGNQDIYGIFLNTGTTPPSSTPTVTSTRTPTFTPTRTPTPTRTRSATVTVTRTPTPTRSGRTYLPAVVKMPTSTPTPTRASTTTPTPSPTVDPYDGDPFEPNDSIGQAWGPLVSGRDYFAYVYGPQDQNDFYFFTMPTAHTIEVWLNQIPAGHDYNLYLYNDSSSNPIGYSANVGNQPEHILTAAVPGGRYYVRVRPVAGYGAFEPYRLKVVYR